MGGLLIVPATTRSSLRQGDLIKLVACFETGALTGQPDDLGATLGLVVSRDCVAENKPRILVAAVRAANLLDPKVLTGHVESPVERFDAVVAALDSIRDGSFSPDRFYLGSVPGGSDRLVAYFDEIACVALPKDRGAREEWILANRVACLEPDALRALPTRLFWALCRGGFDDHAWLPTPDLEIVCDAGQAAQSHLDRIASDLKLELTSAQMDPNAKKQNLESRAKTLEASQAKADQFRRRLDPYLAEKRNRSSEE